MAQQVVEVQAALVLTRLTQCTTYKSPCSQIPPTTSPISKISQIVLPMKNRLNLITGPREVYTIHGQPQDPNTTITII